MRDRVLRVVLVLAAVGTGGPGTWALLAPRSFFDSFPGSGHAWVAADGPFNEHLVRDFGSLNLALTLVLVMAAWKLAPSLVTAGAGAALIYGAPHLLYHLNHLDVLKSSTDKSGEIGALAFGVALAVVALALNARRTSSVRAVTR